MTRRGKGARATQGRTLAAFANRNFRLYFGGQSVSQIGTWMQNVAQAWLVYSLTGSATAIGVTVALQSLPTTLLGAYGGVLADRLDKRTVVVLAQSCMGLLALVLGALTLADAVELWHVYILATLLGVARALEIPARQAFLMDMVGADHLRNAVSLNSLIPNLARMVGPAMAGVLIATTGVGICFVLNAASYVAVVAAFLAMDVPRLAPSRRLARSSQPIREGLRYVNSSRTLRTPLVMMALVGCFALQWQIVLPILATEGFSAGPETFGFMMATVGAGAIAGALLTARFGRTGLGPLTAYVAALGLSFLFAALAPTLLLELLALAAVGVTSVTLLSSSNATFQLTPEPWMRGRVIALWLVAVDGLSPVGGPLVGLASEAGGGRPGFAVAGLACVTATAVGIFAYVRESRPAEPLTLASPELGSELAESGNVR